MVKSSIVVVLICEEKWLSWNLKPPMGTKRRSKRRIALCVRQYGGGMNNKREFYDGDVIELKKCPKCDARYPLRNNSIAFCTCGHLDMGHLVHVECAKVESKRIIKWVTDQFAERTGNSLEEKNGLSDWSKEELDASIKILTDSFSVLDPRTKMLHALDFQKSLQRIEKKYETASGIEKKYETAIKTLGSKTIDSKWSLRITWVAIAIAYVTFFLLKLGVL
jgi:hypothetical protein